MKQVTLKLLWTLIEIAASVRAALATYTVVYLVSNDIVFSLFTTAVVELAFLVSLMSIGSDASAPIAAFLTLGFSAAMQYLEVLSVSGALTENDKFVLRSVIAFAPIVILLLSYIRRLVGETDTPSIVSKLRGAFSGVTGGDKPGGASVTKSASVTPIGGRSRTCSECGNSFSSSNAKRVTCSSACRVARSRRLGKS